MGDGAVRRPGRYLDRLDLYELAGHNGQWYCLLERLRYQDEDGTVHEAPAGTLTDFASVPRLAWSVFQKVGKHSKAAVIHDCQCAERLRPSPTVHAAIFRRGVRACGCSRITQACLWLAVRLFGPRFRAR